MTRTEAVKQLKEYILGMNYMDDEAVWMAIQTLEQQPCEDCISRQALIEKATSWDKHFADSERCVSLTDIQNASSVIPQAESEDEKCR